MRLTQKKEDELAKYICDLFNAPESEREAKTAAIKEAFGDYGIAPKKDKLDYIPEGQMSIFDYDEEDMEK